MKMYYTFEELVAQYIAKNVYVSIKELEEEGLLQEFCDRVEELAPTTKDWKTHQEVYDYYVNRGFDNLYFEMHVHELDDETLTYCTIRQHAPEYKIAHLIYDVPPIDMESLLAE